MSEKTPLNSIFRDNPSTPEGKFLVKRRDSSVPEWPSFVLGGADPIAEVALRAYASEVFRLLMDAPEQALRLGLTRGFYDSLCNLADTFNAWRTSHGQSDPGMGPHRKDDPATIAEMKKGYSA